ncbi:hypothetical protein BST20_15590 [Mycobacterium branderi]|uniref:Uncharacterized protein n=1 Tax=Mycobacterium branderi TaxID=43348 RepID=A0A7I7W160_9MYCO|nr:hypothetical protein BST20_15590 [Mycobacterium branderi]BBZ11319.1 hypothetical protein MBRA_15140 [Mycobacterium branderi]
MGEQNRTWNPTPVPPVKPAGSLTTVRSDDDTWDITSGVGSTALFVAAARALEARRSDPVAVDPYASVFCRAAGGTPDKHHQGHPHRVACDSPLHRSDPKRTF